MLHDIWCVTWKELMLARRNLKSYLTSYGLVIGLWGVFLPASSAHSIWQGEATISILLFAYLSVLLGSGQTISTFVSERMQKTLGTLLTTRLSDATIYLGKVLAVILISYIVMLVVLGLHLGTLIVVGQLNGYPLRFPYSLLQFVFLLVLPLIALLYTSSLGVYISLKSTNIRGQHFLNLFMGLPVFVMFYFVLQSLTWKTLLISLAIFGFISFLITRFSIARFNRQRLILM
ncbi:MAG: hypothetical protein D6723_10765 [Acidobacteria bacterium]|nr:MAG: hypothetical protein D6723_10765 [Acidobacteriota bacterium]